MTQNYSRDAVILAASKSGTDGYYAINKLPTSTYTCEAIEFILSRVRRTSPGIDNIPFWVYRDCASELERVVTKLVNVSVGSGAVPSAWRTAIITPVPKCMPVTELGDLRPISVTLILSRIVERLIVKDNIFPVIPVEQLHDQFGFKPTGSTTAALIDLTNAVSIMLEDNKYVRCLLIDFSKAFDSVNHVVLIKKLKLLNILDNILQWVVAFLTDRDKYTKLGDKRFSTRFITRSIV